MLDVKHYGRYCTHIVADGHLTEIYTVICVSLYGFWDVHKVVAIKKMLTFKN